MMSLELSPGMDKAVDLACFKDMLLQTCGHSFEKEREQALTTALGRRMSALNIKQHEMYHACLLRDHDELLRLTELLTVNETYFFREPDHLKLLIDILPKFMAGRAQEPVRILSAGCSTGEEPYSIAMMLRERFGDDSDRLFTITGVDIDSTVIASAKQGVYGTSSFRGINNPMLDRYFKPSGPGKFRIDETIRRQVEFEVVNLLGSAYPQRMQSPDIILYRNVSIYFPSPVQHQIFRKLAELLVGGGCLLVGATETMHHDVGILSLVKHDSLFFYSKPPHLVFEERRKPSRVALPPEMERRKKEPRSALRISTVSAGKSEAWQNLRQEGSSQERPPNQPPSTVSPNARERYETALELARDNRPDEALVLLDAINVQDASFTKAYILKAHLLLSASRFDEVVDISNMALEQNPLCPEIYLMLGMIKRHQGHDDDALKRFREALYLDPSCWLAHFYSAEILYGLGDEKRARSGYEAAARVLEKNASRDHGQAIFPLSFNADQFIVICRHKLSLLTGRKSQKNGI